MGCPHAYPPLPATWKEREELTFGEAGDEEIRQTHCVDGSEIHCLVAKLTILEGEEAEA